jgi:hypothetical protein
MGLIKRAHQIRLLLHETTGSRTSIALSFCTHTPSLDTAASFKPQSSEVKDTAKTQIVVLGIRVVPGSVGAA